MLEVSDQIKLHCNRLTATICTLYCTYYLPRLAKMDAITYTTARQNLAQTMSRVCVDYYNIGGLDRGVRIAIWRC